MKTEKMKNDNVEEHYSTNRNHKLIQIDEDF